MLDQLPPSLLAPKMPSKLLGLGPKTDIRICLASKRRVYSTLDRVQGTVHITPSADLPFDDIDVEFVGTSRTYVERLSTAAAVSGRSQAFHQFLRLSQPALSDYYPEDRILRAGQTYKLPFFFVVPQQLLPRVCGHKVTNDNIRDVHLQLPPSLGDCEAETRDEQLDDLAPEMASIRYGVYAKISKLKQDGNTSQRVTVVAKARKVRVVPAFDESPPLNTDNSSEYSLRKEKKLRKGLLKGKLGTLVMEAQQPASFRLPPQDGESDERTTTMATVMLRFEPSEKNVQPPRLNTLSTKLKATTFYSTAARTVIPQRSDSLNDLCSGFHSENLDLSSRCMANVDWTLINPDGTTSESSTQRRSSSTVSGPFIPPNASAHYSGGAFYVARILVPIALPTNKAFVPTFHSCLISRSYKLAMSLSTHAGLNASIDLKVPVQISASPSLSTNSPRPSVTSLTGVEIDDEDASSGIDDFFEPRTIHAPEEDFIGGSRLDGGTTEPDPASQARRDSGFATAAASAPPQQADLPEYSLFAPGSRGRRPVPAF